MAQQNCPSPIPTQTLYGTSYYTTTIYSTVTQQQQQSSTPSSSSPSSSGGGGSGTGTGTGSASSSGGGGGAGSRRDLPPALEEAQANAAEADAGSKKRWVKLPRPPAAGEFEFANHGDKIPHGAFLRNHPLPRQAPEEEERVEVATPAPSAALVGKRQNGGTYTTSTVETGSSTFPTSTLYSTPPCDNNTPAQSSSTPQPQQSPTSNPASSPAPTSQQGQQQTTQASQSQSQQQQSAASATSAPASESFSVTAVTSPTTLMPTTDAQTTRSTPVVTFITSVSTVFSAPSPSGGGVNGLASSGDGSGGGGGSNTGAIAGGVVGGVLGLAALAVLAFALMRKRKREERSRALMLDDDKADRDHFAPSGGAGGGGGGVFGALFAGRKRKHERLESYFEPTSTVGGGTAMGAGGSTAHGYHSGGGYGGMDDALDLTDGSQYHDFDEASGGAHHLQMREVASSGHGHDGSGPAPALRRESWGMLGVDVLSGQRLGAESPISRHMSEHQQQQQGMMMQGNGNGYGYGYGGEWAPMGSVLLPQQEKTYAGLSPSDTFAYYAVGAGAGVAASQQQHDQQHQQMLLQEHPQQQQQQQTSEDLFQQQLARAISPPPDGPLQLPDTGDSLSTMIPSGAPAPASPKNFGFLLSSPARALSPTHVGTANNRTSTASSGNKEVMHDAYAGIGAVALGGGGGGEEEGEEEYDDDAKSNAAISTLAGSARLSRGNSIKTDGSHNVAVTASQQQQQQQQQLPAVPAAASTVDLHHRAKSDTSMLDAAMSKQIQYTSQPLPALPPTPVTANFNAVAQADAAAMYSEAAAAAAAAAASAKPQLSRPPSSLSLTSSNGGLKRKPAPLVDESALADGEAMDSVLPPGSSSSNFQHRSHSSGSLNRFITDAAGGLPAGNPAMSKAQIQQQMMISMQMQMQMQMQAQMQTAPPPSSWRQASGNGSQQQAPSSPTGSQMSFSAVNPNRLSGSGWSNPSRSRPNTPPFTPASYENYPSRYTHLDAPELQQQAADGGSNTVRTALTNTNSAMTVPTLSSASSSQSEMSSVQSGTPARPSIPSGFRSAHQRPRSQGSSSDIPGVQAILAGKEHEIRPLTGTHLPIRPTHKDQRHSASMSVDAKGSDHDGAEIERIASGFWHAPGTLHIVNSGP